MSALTISAYTWLPTMISMETTNRMSCALLEQRNGSLAALWDAAQRLWVHVCRPLREKPRGYVQRTARADRPQPQRAMRVAQRDAADLAARTLALRKRDMERRLHAAGWSLTQAKCAVAHAFAHTNSGANSNE